MDFKVINCKKCGKLYNKAEGGKFCPVCMKELEEKYLEVRQYIRDNKGASIVEVSRETDVSVEQIREWIREERIELNTPDDPTLTCLSCGTPVKTGRYCEHCKGKLADAFKGVYVKKQESNRDGLKSNGEKMRFLQK